MLTGNLYIESNKTHRQIVRWRRSVYIPEKGEATTSDRITVDDYGVWSSNDGNQPSSFSTSPSTMNFENESLRGYYTMHVSAGAGDPNSTPAHDTHEDSSSPNWVRYGSSSPIPSSPPQKHDNEFNSIESGRTTSRAMSYEQLGDANYGIVSSARSINRPTIFLRPSLTYPHHQEVSAFEGTVSDSSIEEVAITEEFHASAFLSEDDEDEYQEDCDAPEYAEEMMGPQEYLTQSEDDEVDNTDHSGKLLGPSDDSMQFERYKEDLERMRQSLRHEQERLLVPKVIHRGVQTSTNIYYDRPSPVVTEDDFAEFTATRDNYEGQVTTLVGKRRVTKRARVSEGKSMPALSWIILLMAYILGLLVMGWITWEVVAMLLTEILGVIITILDVIYGFPYKTAVAALYRQVRANMKLLDEAIEIFLGLALEEHA
ncbi:hypothetical protein TWF696_008625 [Orbilia brochopaga]|uniref:Uncharacterized protein n=1 Tax=Orbilia brochopaga TaxID=3140254 RepID=A0AAV9ULZ9_9PEZI